MWKLRTNSVWRRMHADHDFADRFSWKSLPFSFEFANISAKLVYRHTNCEETGSLQAFCLTFMRPFNDLTISISLPLRFSPLPGYPFSAKHAHIPAQHNIRLTEKGQKAFSHIYKLLAWSKAFCIEARPGVQPATLKVASIKFLGPDTKKSINPKRLQGTAHAFI